MKKVNVNYEDRETVNKGLSVIIPCYNARDTIIDCIESIENRIIDTEVIVIEDCSIHNSKDLIEKYKENTNLSIIYLENTENLGAGRTRNRGISLANKEYITFIDSDDVLTNSYFECVSNILSDNYDEIIYDAEHVFGNDSKKMSMFYSDSILDGEIAKDIALVYIKGCTCGKIYKTSMIKDNNIEFGSINRNEDLIFTKLATACAEKIYYINQSLYKYMDNEKSLMNNHSLLTTQNAIMAYELIYERLSNRGFYDELNSMYLIEILYSTTNTMLSLNETFATVKKQYKIQRKRYDINDKYRKRYSLIYRVSFLFFELGLFRSYVAVRDFLKNKRR